MSGEKRAEVKVRTRDVRPQEWITATREVQLSEVNRRSAASTAAASDIPDPLLATPLVELKWAPAAAFAAAGREHEDAKAMVALMKRECAPDKVVAHFQEHEVIMGRQAGHSAVPDSCAKDTTLPRLLLLDGNHRWHIAIKNNKEYLWTSIPVRYEKDFHIDVEKTQPASSQDGTAHPSTSVLMATMTGAQMNYASHMSTAMSTGDRVFLLQSWFVATMNACRTEDQRSWMARNLTTVAVHDLLHWSVSEHFEARITVGEKRSDFFDGGVTFENIVGRGREVRKKIEAEHERCKWDLQLVPPPVSVLVVAPTSKTLKETLCPNADDLVFSAVTTAMDPVSRKIVGLILRDGVTSDDFVVDVDSMQTTRSAAESTWTGSLSGISTAEGIAIAIRTANGMLGHGVAEWSIGTSRLGDGRPSAQILSSNKVGHVPAILIIVHGIASMRLYDALHAAQALKRTSKDAKSTRKRLAWREVRTLRTNALTIVISALLKLWRDGMSLKEIAGAAGRMRFIAFASFHVLGKKYGALYDREYLSLLAYSGPRPGHVENGQEFRHSIRCFLLHVPSSDHLPTSRRRTGDSTSWLSTLGPGVACLCDWYAEQLPAEHGIMSSAFIPYDFGTQRLGRNQHVIVTPSADPGKPSGPGFSAQTAETRRETHVHEEFLDGILCEHHSFVQQCQATVDACRSALEAKNTVINTTTDKTPGNEKEFAEISRGLIKGVSDVLEALYKLAEEGGLRYASATENYFKEVCNVLKMAEAQWIGTKDAPGLVIFYESVEADMVTPGEVDEDADSLPKKFDLVSRWRTRLARFTNAERKRNAAEAEREREEKRRGFAERRKAGARKTQALRVPAASLVAAGAVGTVSPQGDPINVDVDTNADRAVEAPASGAVPLAAASTGLGAGKRRRTETVRTSTAKPAAKRRKQRPCVHSGPTRAVRQGGNVDCEAAIGRRSMANSRSSVHQSKSGGAPPASASSVAPCGSKTDGVSPSHDDAGRGDPPVTQEKRKMADRFFKVAEANVFNDNNPQVPDDIYRAYRKEQQEREEHKPPSVPEGSNVPYFVNASTLKEIGRWAATAVDGYMKEKNIVTAVEEMDEHGFLCLEGVLQEGSAREDIVDVINVAKDRLILEEPAEENGGKKKKGPPVDCSKVSLLIPNYGGAGRSQTDNEFWQQLQKSGKEEDEKYARAFNSTVARSCALVSELMRNDSSNVRFRDRSSHKCPKTGGRVLVSHPPCEELLKGGLPQKPHCDFEKPLRFRGSNAPPVGKLTGGSRSVPLFVICTAYHGRALRVYAHSHRWAFCTSSLVAEACRTAQHEMFWIPPFSFFAMRGDVYHAGSAWAESKWMNLCYNIDLRGGQDFKDGLRAFHMYFKTDSSTITNNVHHPEVPDDGSTYGASFRHTGAVVEELDFPTTNGKTFKDLLDRGKILFDE